MDEPTNHLDMESIESLQMAMEKYEGTIILVSHDRQFVDAVANRIFIVKAGGRIIDWHGNYEDYLQSEGLS
ncbi:MAG: hypothetical protein EBT08_18945 [Betaproteobacteria bacterium]|nr:hypothetical protein [Betaproteobacteria bacterium]